MAAEQPFAQSRLLNLLCIEGVRCDRLIQGAL